MGTVEHTYNPSKGEGDAGESEIQVKLCYFVNKFRNQLRLHETISQKEKKEKKRKEKRERQREREKTLCEKEVKTAKSGPAASNKNP